MTLSLDGITMIKLGDFLITVCWLEYGISHLNELIGIQLFNNFLNCMSTENKDKKPEENKEAPKEVKKVKEIQKDAEVLKLLEEDEDDFE